MQTVVETQAYLKRAEKLLSEDERFEIVSFLAASPEAGQIMAGTGGVRKVRVALEGRGKSGGARVIYYFHNDRIPLFLFAVYAKSEKDNLTKAERNALKAAVETITKGSRYV